MTTVNSRDGDGRQIKNKINEFATENQWQRQCNWLADDGTLKIMITIRYCSAAFESQYFAIVKKSIRYLLLWILHGGNVHNFERARLH